MRYVLARFGKYWLANKVYWMYYLKSSDLKPNFRLLLLFGVISLASSCNINQFLSKDQYLVKSNKINITNIPNKKTKKNLAYELSSLYKQKELPSILFMKRKNGAWFYFKGQIDTDTSRFRRWIYKSFSTRPAIFDELQTDFTVQNMLQFLKNKGYLYPTVSYDKDFHNKDRGLADIIYHVNPGQLYVLDTVQFISPDTAIQYLINDIADNSFLKKGQPLSSYLYDQERQRITDGLNNFGYARFTPNYIAPMEADTFDTGMDKNGNRKVNIKLRVQQPSPKTQHLKFYTADVIVYPNYDARLGETIARDSIVEGRIFLTYDGKIGIRPSTLNKSIGLNPGRVYNKNDIDLTIRQLSNLGLYKFVNVKPNIEECDSTLITYKVYLTPNKKMSFEAGAELNYSSISQTYKDSSGVNKTSNLGRIGLAADIGFEHKNLFNGAERLNSVISGGIEVGIRGGDSLSNGRSYDFKFDNNISVPRFVKIAKTLKLFNRMGILQNNFYNHLEKDATTNFNISYNVSDRRGLDLYKLQQFNLGFKYILLQHNGSERYSISPTGVELNINELRPSFKKRLNGRTLKSFDNQLMTGFAFRSFTYDYSGKPNIENVVRQYGLNIEQSGSEIWLAEKITGAKTPFKVADSLGFSKYWRIDANMRYTRQFSAKTAYYAHFSAGLVAPFSKETNTPYSRLFYVGGPNSIRAWPIRGLGPGGYDNSKVDGVPFQAGDMKLELNSELRFPVFWRFESALFLDAGNIWDIRESIENGRFGNKFLNQIAIGTGIGLRIDATYAIIRIDFGYKLRSPYLPEGASNHWIGFNSFKWSNFNPNFALNYPF